MQILVEGQFLSAAQAQLVQADHDVTGMPIEEILLARHWVDEATLERLAPWLRKAPEPPKMQFLVSDRRNYQENLKNYRQLMEKVLGISWD